MKKLRFILPIIAVAVMLFGGINAEAAENALNLKAGTKETTAKIVLKDVLSAEGYLYLNVGNGSSFDDFFVKDIRLSSSDKDCAVYRLEGNQFMVVGRGKPMTVTIAVDMEFYKDGTYIVAIDGGETQKDGTYVNSYEGSNMEWLESVKVVVGDTKGSQNDSDATDKDTDKDKDKDKDDDKEDKKTSSTTSTTTTGTTPNGVKPITSTTQTTAKTSDKMTASGDKKVEIDKTTLPKSEEVKEALEKAEEELGVDLNSNSEEEQDDSSNLMHILRIIVSVLGLITLAVGGYFLWKHENAVEEEDYEGAATLDYDIEDDDIVDGEDYDDAYEDEEE